MVHSVRYIRNMHSATTTRGTAMQIKTETIEDVTYYMIESRGVVYTIYFQDVVGAWCVGSRRKSLGRRNMGSSRYFKTLDAIEKKIKGLFGISALIQSTTNVQA